MGKFSPDLLEMAIGKESTRGTRVAPTYGMKWRDNSLIDKAMMAVDDSRNGIIADSRNSHVVGTYLEGDLGGPVRDQSIALLLYSLMGTLASAVVGGESVVYEHTINLADSNQHQSLTIHKKDPQGGYDHPNAVVNSLEMLLETDKMFMFTAGMRSKARATAVIGTFTVTIATPGVGTLVAHTLATGDAVTLSTTGALPTGLTAGTTYFIIRVDADTIRFATTLANALAATAITTSGSQSGVHTLSLSYRYIVYPTENTFLPQHASLKIASAFAGLDGASATNIRSAKLTMEGNVQDDRSLGSVIQTDIINTQFSAELEVQIVMSANTYVTALLAGTSYALRLDVTNTDVVLGTASNPRVRFDLYKAILQDAPPAYALGDLVIQTLRFKIHYSETDSKMLVAYVRNLEDAY